MPGFEAFQFAEQAVVFRVGDLGTVFNVVQPVVVLEKRAKLARPFSSLGRRPNTPKGSETSEAATSVQWVRRRGKSACLGHVNRFSN